MPIYLRPFDKGSQPPRFNKTILESIRLQNLTAEQVAEIFDVNMNKAEQYVERAWKK